MAKYLQLVINPGSTSTKIAVYSNNDCVFSKTLRHNSEDLKKFNKVIDQFAFRKDLIINAIKENGINMSDLNAVVGRGGLLEPLTGGTYLVTDEMIRNLKEEKRGSHASNLGGLIARSIADMLNVPAFIVDPVCVDEMDDIARISGIPEITRESLFHALNQKAVARRAALNLGQDYSNLNLIVAHLGGGISVGAHFKGRIIDVNNAVGGDGPFSPERSGGVPAVKLVEMCFSGKYSYDQMLKKIIGNGGLVAYLNTNNALEIEERIQKADNEALIIYKAMAYQIAKEIGASSAVLKGNVDCIVITGGLAHSKLLVNWIEERIKFIAPVMVFPGEDEMRALAEGGLRVLTGMEKAKNYPEKHIDLTLELLTLSD